MTGFSTESFTFLRGLEDNNNRDWFNENKAQFTKHLEQPFADLLEALSNRLSDARRPLSGGKSTMFRMNRDVRFSKDKTWCDCGGRSPAANEVRYVGLMDIYREENDLWNTMSVWMCR